MRIYRKTSVLSLSTWADKKRSFLEITPALEGASGGQPKAGEQRYDYEKTCRISFKTVEMLQAAFKFIGMSQGAEVELKKFADMSKSVGEGDEQKSLRANIFKGKISISMTVGEKKGNISLEPDEAYAVGKWFEVQAQRFAVEESMEEEDRKREAAEAAKSA